MAGGNPLTFNSLPDGVVSPAGKHSDGHRVGARRFASVMIDGLHWVRKKLPGPGAMNYAFDSLALAESTPIGPGVRQRQYWVKEVPALFVAEQIRPVSGYGGVIQGQYFSQPLFDPYANTFGAIQGPTNPTGAM